MPEDRDHLVLLNGPPEAGAAGMTDSYLKTDSAQRDTYLRSLKDQRHKAVYKRASILLGKLIQHNCKVNALSLLISATARLLCSNAGEKELPSKDIKYLGKDFCLKIENIEDRQPIDSKTSELLEGLKEYIAEMKQQIVIFSDKAKLYDRLSSAYWYIR